MNSRRGSRERGSRERRRSGRPDWSSAWPVALVGSAFLPLETFHGIDLWERPHYRPFPIVVVAALALIWRYGRGLGRLSPGESLVSFGLAFLAWALLAFAVLFALPWLAVVDALFVLIIGAYALGGRSLVHAVLPACAVLACMVPLPGRLDSLLVGELQDLMGLWADQLLDVLKVEHVFSGEQVELAGRRLPVGRSLTGAFSFVVLPALGLFSTLWVKASWPKVLSLLAATLFWVVLGNVIQMVTVVVLASKFGIDASEGWRNALVGALVFLGTVGCIASTWSLIVLIADIVALARSEGAGASAQTESEPVSTGGERQEASRATSLPSLRRTWLGSPMIYSAFGLLLLPQIWLLPRLVREAAGWEQTEGAKAFYQKAFKNINADVVPRWLGEFERRGFHQWEGEAGRASRSWQYARAGTTMTVTLEYPFVGWNDLRPDYTSRGWRVTASRESTEGVPVVVADLADSEGRFGHLIFTHFDQQGRVLSPPDTWDPIDILAGRLQDLWSWQAAGSAGNAPSHRLQVFVEKAGLPLSRAEATRAGELFELALRGIDRIAFGRTEEHP